MPNAIKKSNEEIITMLQIKRMRRGKLNSVQQRVYESLVRAEIAAAAAELFGGQ